MGSDNRKHFSLKMTKKYHSKKDDKARVLYAGIMEEIKRRNKAVYDALNGCASLPKILVSEFCYLQLRFILELIAHGCLVVHGELRNRNLDKKWNAGDLIKALEDLHPDFYPLPTKQILISSDEKPRRFKLEDIKEGFLSKEEFLGVYGRIGNHLHKGNVKKILSKNHDKIDFSEIDKIATRIRILLNHHIIHMVDSDFMIATLMESREDGKVHVTFFEKIDEVTSKRFSAT